MLQKVSYAFFFKISEEKYIAGFTGYLKKKNHQKCRNPTTRAAQIHCYILPCIFQILVLEIFLKIFFFNLIIQDMLLIL